MSHYEHTSAGDHDAPLTYWKGSTYGDLVSGHPIFDPESDVVRLCSPRIIYEGQAAPLVHESRQFFAETGVEASSSRPVWVANVPSLPGLLSQPYAYHESERFRTSFFSSADQVERGSDPLHGNGTSMYTFPVLRPSLGSVNSPTATEPEQHQDHSRMRHSSFIHDSFPLSTSSHFDLRRALATVMTSPWKLQNAFEPPQSPLLGFLTYEKNEKDENRWRCCFWVKGTPCSCNFSKKDQAKNHIRYHIEHLPFSCNERGICPKDGMACFRRFCSAEALQKHRGPQKNCANCGKLMLKSNLRRHNATACRNKRDSD